MSFSQHRSFGLKEQGDNDYFTHAFCLSLYLLPLSYFHLFLFIWLSGCCGAEKGGGSDNAQGGGSRPCNNTVLHFRLRIGNLVKSVFVPALNLQITAKKHCMTHFSNNSCYALLPLIYSLASFPQFSVSVLSIPGIFPVAMYAHWTHMSNLSLGPPWPGFLIECEVRRRIQIERGENLI